MPKDETNIPSIIDTYLVEHGESDEEFVIEMESWKLIHSFHKHKDHEGIAKAIREQPQLFRSGTFRNFVADVVGGTYRPLKSGFIAKRTADKAELVCATVKYYENMGLPIQYESSINGKLNASTLTATRTNTAATTVLDYLKKKEKLTTGWTTYIGNGFHTSDGKSIWVLYGFTPPASTEVIEELEALIGTLQPDQYKILSEFSRGFEPRKLKLPNKPDELALIKRTLESRDNYDFIKSVQIKRLP